MEIQLSNKEAITKAEINHAASELLTKLDSGEISALALLQKFKGVEKIQEAIKSKLTEMAVSEAKKYPEKELNIYGGTFKVQEFGTKYSYENCNDPVHTRLLAELEAAKEALKAREDFLKTIKGSETIVDTENGSGEIITVFPPVKTSQTGVSCSIK